MLFNSYQFIFAFLPIVVGVFVCLARRFDSIYPVAWLVLASLFFYGWWDGEFLVLLLGSITTNYLLARAIEGHSRAKLLLAAGVAINLAVLGYFKYLLFFTDNLNRLFGTDFSAGHILLPLGISFFTFEQIAYLVDVRRGTAPERNFARYALFVAFFPRLVAGPILRASELLPQIPRTGRMRVTAEDIAVGFSMFCFGLFKKTALADGIAPYANPVFAAAAAGEPLDALQAWGGALAYTMRLYFDFSAYSDMAIGCARCFGITFPANFASPYKSSSITEFWRRWHMTLSRFLRDYLYIALGGNRRGTARRYLNLMLTMLLGGLWHGANWTFVVWGGLHGLYLAVNHAWTALSARSPLLGSIMRTRAAYVASWALTFLAVVVGWVFFYSPTLAGAFEMLRGMAGLNGVAVPAGLAAALGLEPALAGMGVRIGDGSGSAFVKTYAMVLGLGAIALLMPNVQELFETWRPTLEARRGIKAPVRISWQLSRSWAVATAAVAMAGIMSIARASEFLYWQF